MKVERQGLNECMLATIAALQGRPLDHVRVEACRAARVDKWDDLIYPHPQVETYWQAIERVAGPKLYPIVHCRYTGAMVPSGERTIPDVGRGVVVVIFDDSTTFHIMPWENGLIYDPIDPHPVTLRDWLHGHPTATVLATRSIKDREPMHYHYGAGLHGYLYQDGPYRTDNYDSAVGALTTTYDLGRVRRERLDRDGYLEMNLDRDGNEYCEIISCSAECPEADEGGEA